MGQAAYDMTEVRRRRAPQAQPKVPLRVEKGGKKRDFGLPPCSTRCSWWARLCWWALR